jgi:hypothetical protein
MPAPANPSSAGSRVLQPSTITATTSAALAPMIVAAGMPATTSPPIAMVTVPPAKTTACTDALMRWNRGEVDGRRPSGAQPEVCGASDGSSRSNLICASCSCSPGTGIG